MRKAVAVFFSKDRAFQLDAALRSFFVHCKDPEVVDVHALVAASTPRHASLYRILELDYPKIQMHREQVFKSDILAIVRPFTYVLFFVDDSIFLADFSIAKAISVLAKDQRCIGFSLRLGKNTGYCYVLGRHQAIPPLQHCGPGLLSFEWPAAEHDFAYPLELSASLYRAANLLPLLEHLDYRNPNLLEGELSNQAVFFSLSKPLLACYERSVVVSVPINIVQSTYENRSGSDPALHSEALADFYSRGDRLCVESYSGIIPSGAHQMLPIARVRDEHVPTVSIIIPCYKQAHFLPESVASVVAQTFTDWDLTIVDDGSPDHTAAVAQSLIARYPERKIRLVRKKNGGVASARNSGIASSRGRYVLPLDADDALATSFLERTVECLEDNRQFAIAYTDQEWFGEEDRTVKIGKFNPFLIPAENLFAYCSLYRREVWEAVNGYNTCKGVDGYEDWDFWVGAVEQGFKAARVPGCMFRYRISTMSRYIVAKQSHLRLTREIRANHPRTYRPWLRVIRFSLLSAKSILYRVKCAVSRVFG